MTGFMGTGKTSVGRALATRLGREFVDMDEVLAEREGMSIADVFARQGEVYFREREGALSRELAARENLVIATGGGALVSQENRQAFGKAHVICLDASVDTILARLDGATDRPLLAGDRRARIERLLAARREAYAEIPLHVNTDGRPTQEITTEIVERLTVRVLRVKTPEGEYPIYLGDGRSGRGQPQGLPLRAQIGELVAAMNLAARCAIVTNPTVGGWYAEQAADSLRVSGFEPIIIEIPDGEPFKTLETVRGLYDELIAAKLERRSPILALGGGVVGDTAGFAAATYLRGVPFIQIPTTLLAMVDASVGGKVGVDHPAGKNLVGAFKFPYAVIADMDVLESLPAEEYRAGMAEVLKHGIIADRALFETLAHGGTLDGTLLERALRVKIEIVERDPYEQNIRAHLNLGHTFGHAIERLANFRMRHGEAVAIGIAIAARLAARIEWCEASTRDEIIEGLTARDLLTRVPREFAPEQIVEAMGGDKKIRGGKLRLVLPRTIGQVDIAENVAREDILAVLNESRA